MWLFTGQTFQGGLLLNPGAVSDPLWRVRAGGDFNHEGHGDLVWQYTPTGQVAFWLLNGSNAIGYALPSITAPGPEWEIFGTGDSLLDGELDLYWQHRSTGTLAVWRMAGTAFVLACCCQPAPAIPAGAPWVSAISISTARRTLSFSMSRPEMSRRGI